MFLPPPNPLDGGRREDPAGFLGPGSRHITAGTGLNREDGFPGLEVLLAVVFHLEVLLDHDGALVEAPRAEVFKVGELSS